MARWHPLEPVDAEFFASAPHIFRYQELFNATPEQVWNSLVSDASAAAWGRLVKEVRWTSSPPLGVGATRQAAALGTRSRSRYFRWDEGQGYALYVYESTAPIFKRLAEDFVLQPSGGGTLFQWTVALEPKSAFALPCKVFAPVLNTVYGRLAHDGKRYFAKQG